MRSRSSFGPSDVVAGRMTAPTFVTASIDSHNSTWLLSISIT